MKKMIVLFVLMFLMFIPVNAEEPRPNPHLWPQDRDVYFGSVANVNMVLFNWDAMSVTFDMPVDDDLVFVGYEIPEDRQDASGYCVEESGKVSCVIVAEYSLRPGIVVTLFYQASKSYWPLEASNIEVQYPEGTIEGLPLPGGIYVMYRQVLPIVER